MQVAVKRQGDSYPLNVPASYAYWTRFHRRFPAWGRFGVSAFVAADEEEVDALCETKLRAWFNSRRLYALCARSGGHRSGATFRVPHVTLADPNVDALTQKLLLCDHRVVVNPYHEPELGSPEGQ